MISFFSVCLELNLSLLTAPAFTRAVATCMQTQHSILFDDLRAHCIRLVSNLCKTFLEITCQYDIRVAGRTVLTCFDSDRNEDSKIEGEMLQGDIAIDR